MKLISALKPDPKLKKRLLIISLIVSLLLSGAFTGLICLQSARLGKNIELHKLHAWLNQLSTLNQQHKGTDTLFKRWPEARDDSILLLVPASADIPPAFSRPLPEGLQSRILQLTTGPSRDGFFSYQGEEYSFASLTTDYGQLMLVRNSTELEGAMTQVRDQLLTLSLLLTSVSVALSLWGSARIAGSINRHKTALTHLATHDMLTDLPNRLYLGGHLDEVVLPHFRSQPDFRATLILIDLDRFKEINDTLGHANGDRVLQEISRRLREFLPAQAIAIRQGADEFVIWLPDTDLPAATSAAHGLIRYCRRTISFDGIVLEMDASAGISSFPRDGETLDELTKNADAAMRQAKQQRQVVCAYEPQEDTEAKHRLKLSSELSTALEKEQFVLYYQPKVSMEDFHISGVEALVRWNHPEEGMLPPGAFVHLIEQSGLVHKFSRYVLKAAVSQISEWKQQGFNISIAVNLSPYNLLDPSLISFIRELLEKQQLNPQLLETELTENASMLDILTTKKAFNNLRQLGIHLSIDDFGTGMSSLAYIKELTVDFVKIDRAFVSQLGNSQVDSAIVSTIIDLCSRLNRKVVAEGVETAEQAEILKQMGCDFGQGYYFSRPVPAHEITAVLEQNQALPVAGSGK